MADINGITADPLAKVAQALSRHELTLESHSKRIRHIEEAREKDERERRNFTWALGLQTVLFTLNMLVSYLMRK